MMLLKYAAYCLTALLISAKIALASSFVCPHTFQTIITGDTTQQVLAACGTPSRIINSHARVETPVFLIQFVYALTNNINTSDNILLSEEAVITFNRDRVSDISSTDPEIHAKFPCLRRIALGNTRADVLIQCGRPNYINHTEKGEASIVPTAEWIYNFGPYQPQLILNFENDELKGVENGPLS